MEILNKKSNLRSPRMTYDQAFAINSKIPPQNLEMEEAVLGSLLIDQNALNNAIETIHGEYFYKEEHRHIFNAIRKLYYDGHPVDILTVVEQLRKDGLLDLVGGAYKVSSLTTNVASGAHIEYHVRVLTEKFIQRELIRIATETIKQAYDETTDVVDLLDLTETRLMEINDNNFRSDYKDVNTLLAEAMEQIHAAQNNDDNVIGIPTGLVDLDRITSGFQRGTLIILAARPAMGKTALALSMARNMAIDFHKPVAFFSLEMTAVELMMRLISSEAEISGHKLKKGELLHGHEKEQLESAVHKLSQAPIYIDDTSQLTIFELRAKCRRLKQKYDIEMVFIDYLQLMGGGADNRNANREQEISNISRQLKALSKELNIPVLAMSQLSRAVETRGGEKKPMLSDLRESGAIEQDADIVMFIYRPEYYGLTEDDKGSTLGMADVIIAKHRSGSVGEARMRFIAEFTKFTNKNILDNFSDTIALSANHGFDSEGTEISTITLGSKMNEDTEGNPSMTPFDDVAFDDESPF